MMAGITVACDHTAGEAHTPEDMQKKWRIILAGEKFMTISASLKSIVSCVKNPLLTFGADGLIVQGTVCGQRIFVPIDRDSFSEYEWHGPTAMFLALTDSRRTLLDAFKCEKRRAIDVSFTFAGEPPCRHLIQAVTYMTDGGSVSNTIIKYELWNASTIFPQKTPDVTFSLNKQQLNKILAVASKLQHEELVFSLKPEGGFYVGTVCTVISFEVDGTAMTQYPYNPPTSATLALVVACRKKKANKNTILTAYGSGKPFCVALEDTSAFRNIVNKIKAGTSGVDLGFYTTCDPPMLCIRPHAFGSPTAFLFCNTDCMTIYELEEVSAVDGAIRAKRINEYFPTVSQATSKKRKQSPPPIERERKTTRADTQ
ncbi:UL42 DNA polymerase processivity subunit [Meleagrid alphaherpesvirus 1]|uniref:DNA polymerase processivity factor n=1 Tax=Meleagrid herpesvirus 1 TaxID=37108 RepID=Q9DH64_MEHV1|nr:DNA polymerase processivity subunit [Meleagrid alphaherpesvirus 1]AKQ48616.1 DNA polymerase processivity subunit [iBAC vector pMeHV1-C7]AKQ48688.1 DNA polymerase processivity subunit [iBAC vector pMeHV1-C9]AKQ48760.1 DNA polymerase processivity subunit [iBAC vector pMeHV1-C10]AKQ48832.1 DNA polymerase processivity subunit [iBAC vector pMeHV1-C17]AKQ48905.1 DNA polymerase processivity subunit [iBAC vector pMeHV1-C18]